MGPVSFESLPAGRSRAEAIKAAELLANAGIRVLSLNDDGDQEAPTFNLVVRSSDASRARQVLAALTPDSTGS
jgi:hypothetical protein